jgi:hypothetical protein
MTIDQFERVFFEIVKIVRKRAPKDTGNLAFNAINFYRKDANTFVIYVDEKIAHYMKYTNENWSLFRPPLKGKKNPNEGWWQDTVQEILQYLIDKYGGELNDND